MTPRERAEQTVKEWEAAPMPKQWREPLFAAIESAITSAITDQTSALQAALEEPAKVKLAYSVALGEISRVAAERDKLEQERDKALESANIQCEIRYSELARAEKAEKERDGLAALKAKCQKCGGYGKVGYQDVDDYPCLEDCPDCKGARQALAAHDRKVAARVLREASKQIHATPWWALTKLADEYEAGTREVPTL